MLHRVPVPTMIRRLGSVRLRIALAAAVVFGIAFGLAAVLLVDSVRSSLESDLRHDGAVAVAGVTRQLAAGEAPDHLELAGRPAFVSLQVSDPSGSVVYKTYGAGVQAPFTLPVPAPSAERGGVSLSTGGATGAAGTNDVFTAPLGGDRILVTRQQVATPHGAFTVVATSSLDSVRRSVDTLVSVLVWGIPFLVLTVGLLVWFLVGRALRPVDSIRAEVEEISHGTLHRRVPVPKAGDEISRLAGTMNEMLDRLDRSARRQREFVSDASHELRSPVASIRTAVEVALHHPESADWPSVVSDVQVDNLRMQHVVDELLDLARIDEDAPAPTDGVVDLADVVREEVRSLDGSTARVTVDAVPASVGGRRSEVALVVRNLLSNACRHARTAVEVTVATDSAAGAGHGGAVRLLVDDDGPGIPPDDRERVFERFARLDEARTRQHGGIGLGLAIVRAVAQRSGWTVAIDESPAGGARVVIGMPRPT